MPDLTSTSLHLNYIKHMLCSLLQQDSLQSSCETQAGSSATNLLLKVYCTALCSNLFNFFIKNLSIQM